MYCPKCGHEQISDVIRYCSRCGLPLSGLTEWVEGKSLPVLRDEAQEGSPSRWRRKGARRGAKLMFLSVVLLPVFLGLSILVDGPVPLLVPIALFLAGLSLTLYTRIFGDETWPAEKGQGRPSSIGPASDNRALPPAPDIRPEWATGQQQNRTAEIVPPPSVTEHTTRLLDSE